MNYIFIFTYAKGNYSASEKKEFHFTHPRELREISQRQTTKSSHSYVETNSQAWVQKAEECCQGLG